MCTGATIHFWCPCANLDPDHFPSRDDRFSLEALGHGIVSSVDTGYYSWCDEYFLSPRFDVRHKGIPPCPMGPVHHDHLHYRSRYLCDDCLRDGCSAQESKRSMYGRRGREEKARWHGMMFQRKMEALRMRIEQGKAGQQTRNQQKLRVVTTDKEDEEHTSWLDKFRSTVRRSRNKRGLEFLQSIGLDKAEFSTDQSDRGIEKQAPLQETDQKYEKRLEASRQEITFVEARPDSSRYITGYDMAGRKGTLEKSRSFNDFVVMKNKYSWHNLFQTGARPLSRASIASEESTASTIKPQSERE